MRGVVKQLLDQARARLKADFSPLGRAVSVVGTTSISAWQPQQRPQMGALVFEELENGIRRELFVAYPDDASLAEPGAIDNWLTGMSASFRERYPNSGLAERRTLDQVV
jgi:hypothetical protein